MGKAPGVKASGLRAFMPKLPGLPRFRVQGFGSESFGALGLYP